MFTLLESVLNFHVSDKQILNIPNHKQIEAIYVETVVIFGIPIFML